MLGPFDYALWMTSFVAEIYVVVWVCAKREFLRYFSLSIYILAAAFQTGSFYYILFYRHYGVASLQYRYLYYYSDSLLTIVMFFVVMHFYQEVFREMRATRYVRMSAAMLLAATAFFSYLVIHQNKDHLTGRFVVELGQNLYFVGVVLTYLLWGAIIKLRETRTRLIQLALALGIFFSADAATYAMRNLFPGLQSNVLRFIPPIVGTFLPLAWAYTFTRIPEEARLETARVTARAATAAQRMAAHQHS